MGTVAPERLAEIERQLASIGPEEDAIAKAKGWSPAALRAETLAGFIAELRCRGELADPEVQKLVWARDGVVDVWQRSKELSIQWAEKWTSEA